MKPILKSLFIVFPLFKFKYKIYKFLKNIFSYLLENTQLVKLNFSLSFKTHLWLTNIRMQDVGFHFCIKNVWGFNLLI